jgi:hypothetical protein
LFLCQMVVVAFGRCITHVPIPCVLTNTHRFAVRTIQMTGAVNSATLHVAAALISHVRM